MKALTQSGRKAYREWLQTLTTDSRSAIPRHLLGEAEMSYSIPSKLPLCSTKFEDKFSLAEALLPLVLELESVGLDHSCWPGVWDGLALHYFECLCPKTADGKWAPNRLEHYSYDSYYRNRHRHRIYGPVTLYRVGKAWVKPFLMAPPSLHGDFEEQIGSRQEIAGNSILLEILNKLYVRENDQTLIRGYTTSRKYDGFKKKLPAPGSLRRFTIVCEQLRRTYDLGGIECGGMLQLLPKEFQNWLKS